MLPIVDNADHLLDGTGPPPLKRFRIRQKGPAPWAVAVQLHLAVPEPQDASAEVAPKWVDTCLCSSFPWKVINLVLKNVNPDKVVVRNISL